MGATFPKLPAALAALREALTGVRPSDADNWRAMSGGPQPPPDGKAKGGARRAARRAAQIAEGKFVRR